MHKWGAVGFRSPLMQHRLGWMHELGCEYDSSTFDVDPFEPQPDGMRTIFPFWVQLPATRASWNCPTRWCRTSISLRCSASRTIDIWKKKLDWIVQQGGMALMNTHPDYMCMDGSAQRDEYPVARYEEFLSYVRDNYGDQCWHASAARGVPLLLCEDAGWLSRNTRRRICMVAYSGYETDGRIRRYAETLARRGDMVDVIALERLSSGEESHHAEWRDHLSRSSDVIIMKPASGVMPSGCCVSFSDPPRFLPGCTSAIATTSCTSTTCRTSWSLPHGTRS